MNHRTEQKAEREARVLERRRELRRIEEEGYFPLTDAKRRDLSIYRSMNLVLRPGEPIPAYSTDAAAAETVLDSLTRLMHHVGDIRQFSVSGPHQKSPNSHWLEEGYPKGSSAWFIVVTVRGEERYVCAPTAAMAICRAALWIERKAPRVREMEGEDP